LTPRIREVSQCEGNRRVKEAVVTQRASGPLLELPGAVRVVDGPEQRGHVLPEAPQPVGAAGLQGAQGPPVGVLGLLEAALLTPGSETTGRRRLGFVGLCGAPLGCRESSFTSVTSACPAHPWRGWRRPGTGGPAAPAWSPGGSGPAARRSAAPRAAPSPGSPLPSSG